MRELGRVVGILFAVMVKDTTTSSHWILSSGESTVIDASRHDSAVTSLDWTRFNVSHTSGFWIYRRCLQQSTLHPQGETFSLLQRGSRQPCWQQRSTIQTGPQTTWSLRVQRVQLSAILTSTSASDKRSMQNTPAFDMESDGHKSLSWTLVFTLSLQWQAQITSLQLLKIVMRNPIFEG